jgi:hypothetical protein
MAHEDDEGVGEDEGGLSTPKKVVAGAALGVAVPAAVGVARKLLSSDDDASSEPMSRERRSSSSRSRSRSTSRPKAKAKAKTKTKTATSRSRSTAKRATSTARRTVNRTREQLYKQATRLKIEGRSSMNKTQLERAIARAKAKAK